MSLSKAKDLVYLLLGGSRGRLLFPQQKTGPAESSESHQLGFLESWLEVGRWQRKTYLYYIIAALFDFLNSSPDTYLKRFCQGNCEETLPAKIEEKSLPKSLWRDTSPPKKIPPRVSSTNWRGLGTVLRHQNAEILLAYLVGSLAGSTSCRRDFLMVIWKWFLQITDFVKVYWAMTIECT